MYCSDIFCLNVLVFNNVNLMWKETNIRVNSSTYISAVSSTQERRHGSLEPPGLPARDSWVPDESRNLLIQGHHGGAAASSSATPTDELFG